MAQLAQFVFSQVLLVPADRSPAVTQRDPGRRPIDDSPLDFQRWETWTAIGETDVERQPSLHLGHPDTASLLARRILGLANSTGGAAQETILLESFDFRPSTPAAQNGSEDPHGTPVLYVESQ